MATQTQNTITNAQLLEAIKGMRQEVRGIKKDISIIYWVLGGFLAFMLFVAGLMFFTWGDVKNLQADMNVLQSQHAVNHP